MSETVLLDRQGKTALLTLNRPERLNALNYATNDLILRYLDELERDDAIHAIIVTGAGRRAFSAGGDIHEFSKSIAAGADIAVRDFCRRGQAMTARLESFPKPVIAAVNGLAYGGGCEIAEAVHLAVAADTALFAKPEINLGIPPTFGGTQRLPRLAGRKRALELLLTGDPFPAERAFELGLVNKVVAPEKVLDAAFDLAGRIQRHSPLAAARILTAVTRGLNTGIAEGLQIEQEQFARMASTRDAREGLNAWIERRVPDYDGAETP
ncbi:crotonase/enoyl-CoA hydratase family protein [Roseibium marinum]|uniref:Enoyl-CoA hydratase/carnithine racemase n=1 Tax=Roseibium marinum TaxID=281252 RepID=A0A2S3UPP8_9HYPH|nr:crotonase/enoyl-CoA hydratase family protein [Roseibium marinum]POF29697.1 enoyl-CoA hydratase/carnithine racemase [Roseibium marinum]